MKRWFSLTDPFVTEREYLIKVPDEDIGQRPMHNVTVQLSETSSGLSRLAPELGENNGVVLRMLGIAPLRWQTCASAARSDLPGTSPSGRTTGCADRTRAMDSAVTSQRWRLLTG